MKTKCSRCDNEKEISEITFKKIHKGSNRAFVCGDCIAEQAHALIQQIWSKSFG